MLTPTRIFWLLFAISPIGYLPLAEWISTAPSGSVWPIWFGIHLYSLFLCPTVFAVPTLAVLLLCGRRRKETVFFLILPFIFIPALFIGGRIGAKVRIAGMNAFVQRSQPLIEAIKKYKGEQSEPPASLDDLVPKYIWAIPSTGMAAYPEIDYYTGEEAREHFCGNPLALELMTPHYLWLNFDSMVYVPLQNYDECEHSNAFQPVGDWIYVWE